MLTLTRLRREMPSDSQKLAGLGLELVKLGWSPLASTLVLKGLELALGPQGDRPPAVPTMLHDDFVFAEDAVLYFEFEPPRQAGAGGTTGVMEVGAIYESRRPVPTKLTELLADLDKALANIASGFAASSQQAWNSIPWRPVSKEFAKIKERAEADGGLSISLGYPEPEGVMPHVLGALEDPEMRKLALRIKASEPLFVIKEQETDAIGPIADNLVTLGLATQRLLVCCRRKNDINLALVARDEVDRLEGECPYCRKKLREELFITGFAPTVAATELLNHSRWLTLRVAQALAECGVASEDVITEWAGGGEEVDFLVNLYGSLAVMELKDRTFGLEDARDLVDRYLRFGAEELVAITTETAAPEARTRLEEVLRAIPKKPSPSVTIVEGLTSLNDQLSHLVQRTNWDAVSRSLRRISPPILLDAETLIAAKFGVPVSPSRRRRAGFLAYEETIRELMDTGVTLGNASDTDS